MAQPTTGPAVALAQKTAAYAHDVQPLLQQRLAASAASRPAPAAEPVPSNVQWVTPPRQSEPPAPGVADSAALPAVPPSPATRPAVAVAPPTPVAVASASSASLPIATLDDDLQKKLQQRARDYPADLAGQLDYQLFRLLSDRPSPDMNQIASLSSEDREIVSAMMDGLSNFRSQARAEDNALLSKKIRPILEMADRLRSQAELATPIVCLCTRVDGFGVYKPLDSTRLSANREHELIVYCEVENFTTRLNDKKMWETRLTEETTLYTQAGLPVWPAQRDAQPVVDLSRNRRHDFFIARKIRLPSDLPVGQYLMKVSIVDAQSNRVAEGSTSLQIVGE